jgi:ABC-type lipoprotein export system ATPase subunit
MSKIKIKNFGPIKEGCRENDGWIDVKKVTVFIGNQGSGKSTVAKLISTMSWIEKAMVKGILLQDELNIYNRFLKQLAYQRIDKYIQDNTVIEYHGRAFSFTFKNSGFKAIKSTSNGYLLPKIMYVPAERNFLSTVDRPDKLKNLPNALYTFNDEYDAAKYLYASGIELPINKVNFEFDKLNKITHIVDPEKNYKIRLSEASSGFQSTVPLYLVTKYLSDSLTAEEDPSIKENSLEEQKELEKEMKLILEDTQIVSEIRHAYLRQLSAKRRPVCFLNIVEEPEQNLFPSSQQKVLYELIKYANTTEGNRLIMTTHSPYIINFLSIAIQGAYLKNEILKQNKSELLKKLEAVIPQKSLIDSLHVAVYQLDEKNGVISKLPSPEGIPSDKNYLNQSIRKGNELFDSLLEIEEEL